MKNNPITTRKILIGLIVFIALLTSGGYFLGYNQLTKEVKQIQDLKLEIESSEYDKNQIESLQRQMSELEDVSKAAKQMLAPISSYKYQEKTLQTIDDYAEKAGIVVNQINFNTNERKKKSQAATNKIPASVAIANPVDYYKLLKFIKLIENGLTQIQITQLSIQKISTEPNEISVSNFTITVYLEGKK